jgi:succinate dehydrogenase/fumarate reductase flavoprotein subunit
MDADARTLPTPPRAAVGSHVVDVVIIGSGAAGLTAAVTARLKGLDVLVLEKDTVFGGTSATSGGGLWIPCSAAARRQGVSDSLADARTYIQHMLGNRFDAARVDAFLENGPKMVDFLEEHNVMTFFTTIDRPDYYPDVTGAGQGGRCIFPVALDARALGRQVQRLRRPARETTFLGMMIKPGPDLHHFFNVFRSFRSSRFVARRLMRHARDVVRHGRSMDLGSGNALVAYLGKAAMEAGVDIRTSSAAKELFTEAGRVHGVRYNDGGATREVEARYGVVLATGGFPHDIARRKTMYRHAPSGHEHRSLAPAANTGDGMRMAEQFGAMVPDLVDAAAWAPVSVVPYRDGTSGTFPHLIDRQKPGFIAVTRRGVRFVNESHSYHEFCRGLAAACAGEPEAYCFLIADHPTIRRYGIGFAKPAPVPLGPYLRSGYLIRGRTLRELAEKAGIDADAFGHTVTTFNTGARRGEDPEFRRGSSAYNRYNGDPLHKPNPCVAPIVRAPFYAVRIVIGELGTFSGVATDGRGRVLSQVGAAIDGLYAVGNDMSHIFAGNYPAGGTTLGPGMTFAYLAACDIAARHDAAR